MPKLLDQQGSASERHKRCRHLQSQMLEKPEHALEGTSRNGGLLPGKAARIGL